MDHRRRSSGSRRASSSPAAAPGLAGCDERAAAVVAGRPCRRSIRTNASLFGVVAERRRELDRDSRCPAAGSRCRPSVGTRKSRSCWSSENSCCALQQRVALRRGRRPDLRRACTSPFASGVRPFFVPDVDLARPCPGRAGSATSFPADVARDRHVELAAARELVERVDLDLLDRLVLGEDVAGRVVREGDVDRVERSGPPGTRSGRPCRGSRNFAGIVQRRGTR